MEKKNYLLKSLACILFLASSLTLFAGCGSIIRLAEFKIEAVDMVPAGQNISYEEHLETLTVSSKPMVVEESVKPDKTLYNAMFFATVNYLPKTTVLIRNSYFTYDPLTKTDWNALDKLTEPTNVDIALYDDAERTVRRILESAFIYKIDDDYIYLGTAGHCIASKNRLKNAKIMFYDRKTYDVDLSDYRLGGKFESAEGDYAMYRFPTSSIPYEELVKLKEVCYSKDAIKNVKAGDVLYTGNIYAKKSSKDYDKKLTVVDESNDSYQFFVSSDDCKVITYSSYIICNEGTTKGQSGSAIFDKYGYAVATVSGSLRGSYKGTSYKLGLYTKLSKLDSLYSKFQ